MHKPYQCILYHLHFYMDSVRIIVQRRPHFPAQASAYLAAPQLSNCQVPLYHPYEFT